jgi:hypothetical protein
LPYHNSRVWSAIVALPSLAWIGTLYGQQSIQINIIGNACKKLFFRGIESCLFKQDHFFFLLFISEVLISCSTWVLSSIGYSTNGFLLANTVKDCQDL